jgi:hypothetical protein
MTDALELFDGVLRFGGFAALAWVVYLGFRRFTDKAGDAALLCTRCGYDCRGSPELCGECGGPSPLKQQRRNERLRELLPPDPVGVRPALPAEGTTDVYITQDRREAALVADHLHRRGIDSNVVDHPDVAPIADPTPGLPALAIRVFAGDVELSLTILQQLDQRDLLGGRVLTKSDTL